MGSDGKVIDLLVCATEGNRLKVWHMTAVSRIISVRENMCFIFSFVLGALSKLRKAELSSVVCVCPSGCPSAWKNSPPTGQNFMKFDYFLSKKSVDKIEILLKSYKTYFA